MPAYNQAVLTHQCLDALLHRSSEPAVAASVPSGPCYNGIVDGFDCNVISG